MKHRGEGNIDEGNEQLFKFNAKDYTKIEIEEFRDSFLNPKLKWHIKRTKTLWILGCKC